ncbi:MAG: glutamate--tRNA ligase, partial [Alphaproteobacteria bacterium]|nr:glutamate--tRNA ligase [Alphaproteobacteria bacterium]
MSEAVRGQIPQFAHSPLLTAKEGKLSKRLGSLGVRELRAEGIENMAICSFLAKLGTSEAIEPYYDLQTLADSLDFAKLGRSQPKFDEEELKLFNHRFVRQMPYDEVKDRVGLGESFWNGIRGNLNTVAEAKIWEDVCTKPLGPVMEDEALTTTAADLLPPEPWSEETYGVWMNEVKSKTNKKGKELFHPIRKALTALDNGPELKVLLPFIGRERAVQRLKGIKA